MKNWIWIAALVALVLGCSGKSESPPTAKQGNYGGNDAQTTGGRKSTGGYSGTSVGGGGGAGQGTSTSAGGSSTQSPAGPSVKITSPVAVADPNSGPVVEGASVSVLCTVSPGTAAVSPGQTKITMTDAKGVVTNATTVNPTQNQNEYRADFQLVQVPSGAVKFECTGFDASAASLSNKDTVNTFIDHGPTILVSSPAKNAAVAGSLNVEFTVTPTPLVPSGDSGSEIRAGSVTLTVDGTNIEIHPDPNDPTLYAVAVNLNNLPQPLPDSINVNVTAENERSLPGSVTANDSRFVNLDVTGPVITPTRPTENTVIGGQTLLSVSLDDGPTGSGVNLSSLTVYLGDVKSTPHPYSTGDSNWTIDKNFGYTYTFDSSQIQTPGVISQVTVNVTVLDKVGNQSTKSWLLYRDDAPPYISLDPPLVRVLWPNGSDINCSVPFDPLGIATSTLDHISPGNGHVFIRALVLEQTNIDNGQFFVFYSGLDTSSVKIFVNDSGKPILVGKTAGGPCVDIEPNVKAKSAGQQYPLTGVPLWGSTPDNSGTDFSLAPNPSPYVCKVGSSGTTSLCAGKSDLKYIMPQRYSDTTATAIFAMDVNTTRSDDSLCAGNQWLLGGTLSDGWLCFAAQGSDAVGNTAVSAPMPVCMNLTGTGSCSSPPPSCTDGCVPPSRSRDGDDASGNPLPFVVRYFN